MGSLVDVEKRYWRVGGDGKKDKLSMNRTLFKTTSLSNSEQAPGSKATSRARRSREARAFAAVSLVSYLWSRDVPSRKYNTDASLGRLNTMLVATITSTQRQRG